MSYSWDKVGNLTNRTDLLNGFSENFCYDPLERLTNYSVSYSGGSHCDSGDVVKSISYTNSDNSTTAPLTVTSATRTISVTTIIPAPRVESIRLRRSLDTG